MPARERTTRRVTIDDIARATGVSKATVSKALNDRHDVSDTTRDNVRHAAARLGYHLRTREPSSELLPNVAVVTSTFDALHTLQILSGAVQECARRGYSMSATHLLLDVPPHIPRPLTDDWLKIIESKGYVGLILVTTPVSNRVIASCTNLGLPIVAIDPTNRPGLDVLSIGATNWNGGLDATQHLIDLGHTRIAYISGPAESLPSIERRQGYLSALQINGIESDPHLIAGSEFTFDAGLEAARKMLRLPENDRPTAFFAGSDWSALGAIEAAREFDLRVPTDISVIGFDDTALATSSAPRLTTVRQPLIEIGAAAVRSLADLRSGNGPTAAMKLNTALIVRASTAPPPQA